jgi:DNA-binding transcriptional ArsR family regulator
MSTPVSAAPLFAALGDETRLHLVSRLGAEGPLSIKELTTGESITRQAITKHLTVMQGAGLVRNSRAGRESLWELETRRIEEAKHYLDIISKQWDDALGRLQEFVERDSE